MTDVEEREVYGVGDWVAKESLQVKGKNVEEMHLQGYFASVRMCGPYTMMHVVKDIVI